MFRICILIMLLVSCRKTELSPLNSDILNPKNPKSYVLGSLFFPTANGSLEGVSFSTDRMFAYSPYNAYQNKITILESTDGANFTKSVFSVQNCLGGLSSSGCYILDIQYENGTYRVVMAELKVGKPSSIRIGTGSSLSSLTFTQTAPPSGFLNITNTISSLSFLTLNTNQTLYFYLESALYAVTNSSWQSVSMSSFQKCKSLYMNDAGSPTCDLLYYHNGTTWTNSPFSTTANITQNSLLDQTAPVFYINGKYWAFTQNGLLYSSSSGTFLSSLTFSSLYNLSGAAGSGTPQISLRSDGKGLVALNGFSGNLLSYTSSNSGSTWTPATTLKRTLYKIGSLGSSFYMAASESGVIKIYKSDTGTSWTAVTLPSF